jgi:hypothetical protein
VDVSIGAIAGGDTLGVNQISVHIGRTLIEARAIERIEEGISGAL